MLSKRTAHTPARPERVLPRAGLGALHGCALEVLAPSALTTLRTIIKTTITPG